MRRLALALPWILACPAAAQSTQTLLPVEDTYVQDINPASNFGASQDLWFGRGSFFGLGVIRTLVLFDLATLPSDARRIRNASFQAYQHSTEPAAGGMDCELHTCDASWRELTATWSNQPPFDSRVWASAKVGDSFYSGWIEWDATGVVREHASGALPHLGWLFKVPFETAGVSRLGYFHSKEYQANPARRPKLVVETYDLLLDVGPLRAGMPAMATLSGAAPGRAVIIAYSVAGLGTTTVPQLGIDLELASAALAARGHADASGAFSASRMVPAVATGRSVWVQAASFGQLSNVVAETVQ